MPFAIGMKIGSGYTGSMCTGMDIPELFHTVAAKRGDDWIVGFDALKMPKVYRPVRDGVIQVKMKDPFKAIVSHALRVADDRVDDDTVVVAALPSASYRKARQKSVKDIMDSLRVQPHTFPEAFIGAAGAFSDLDDFFTSSFLGVNLGANSIDICGVIDGEYAEQAGGGQLLYTARGKVGEWLDLEIMRQLKTEAQLFVSLQKVERLKKEHAFPDEGFTVEGLDIIDQRIVEKPVRAALTEPFLECASDAAMNIAQALSKAREDDREVLRNVILNGGTSCIPNIARLIQDELANEWGEEVEIFKVRDPHLSVVREAFRLATVGHF